MPVLSTALASGRARELTAGTITGASRSVPMPTARPVGEVMFFAMSSNSAIPLVSRAGCPGPAVSEVLNHARHILHRALAGARTPCPGKGLVHAADMPVEAHLTVGVVTAIAVRPTSG